MLDILMLCTKAALAILFHHSPVSISGAFCTAAYRLLRNFHALSCRHDAAMAREEGFNAEDKGISCKSIGRLRVLDDTSAAIFAYWLVPAFTVISADIAILAE